MTIASYINDLLYRYDCVIVPNFGGFVTNRIGAKKDAATHTFYPPTKQIAFNAHLKHNDGLLVNYIASTENISFEEASKNIALSVAQWKKDLQSSTVEIGSIGNLSLNTKQQIVFEPNTTVNFLTASFGLSSVETTSVKRFKQQVKPLVLKQKESSSFIKYAAAAAAAILLTLGWNGYQNNQHTEAFATQQKVLEQKIQTATFIIDNPLPTINLNVSKVVAKNFHIISGAFRFPENADKKVSQLKKKGFKAQILGKNKWGLTVVTFKSFETRKEASKELRKIQRSISKDAWLLVKKRD